MSHIEFAHDLWLRFLDPGDHVIDATCGNGRDTQFLANLVPKGKVIAYDIQEKAISTTLSRLPSQQYPQVQCILGSHAQFSSEICGENVRLIIYNLGYLPGGNKTVTTQTKSTLLSIESGLHLLCARGALCITCYPGHAEGAKEEAAIQQKMSHLSSAYWDIIHCKWTTRHADAPTLFWVYKKSRYV